MLVAAVPVSDAPGVGAQGKPISLASTRIRVGATAGHDEDEDEEDVNEVEADNANAENEGEEEDDANDVKDGQTVTDKTEEDEDVNEVSATDKGAEDEVDEQEDEENDVDEAVEHEEEEANESSENDAAGESESDENDADKDAEKNAEKDADSEDGEKDDGGDEDGKDDEKKDAEGDAEDAATADTQTATDDQSAKDVSDNKATAAATPASATAQPAVLVPTSTAPTAQPVVPINEPCRVCRAVIRESVARNATNSSNVQPPCPSISKTSGMSHVCSAFFTENRVDIASVLDPSAACIKLGFCSAAEAAYGTYLDRKSEMAPDAKLQMLHGRVHISSEDDDFKYLETRTGFRTVLQRVQFAVPYKGHPDIHLATSGLEMDNGFDARYQLFAQNVDRFGFDLVVSTWADSRLLAVDVDWVATSRLFRSKMTLDSGKFALSEVKDFRRQVYFHHGFGRTPDVSLSLVGYHARNGAPAELNATAVNVTARSFIVEFQAPATSQIEWLAMSWMAFVNETRMYTGSVSLDAETNRAFKKFKTASGTRTIDVPVRFIPHPILECHNEIVGTKTIDTDAVKADDGEPQDGNAALAEEIEHAQEEAGDELDEGADELLAHDEGGEHDDEEEEHDAPAGSDAYVAELRKDDAYAIWTLGEEDDKQEEIHDVVVPPNGDHAKDINLMVEGADRDEAIEFGADSITKDTTDRAMRFDKGYLMEPEGESQFPQLNGAFSVEMWIHPQLDRPRMGLFDRFDWATKDVKERDGIVISLVNNAVHFEMFNGRASVLPVVVKSRPLTAGVIYHVVCTFDKTEMRIYLNGKVGNALVGSSMSAGPTDEWVRIGAYGEDPQALVNGIVQTFHGVISHVAVYVDTALSENQVSDHFTLGNLPSNNWDDEGAMAKAGLPPVLNRKCLIVKEYPPKYEGTPFVSLALTQFHSGSESNVRVKAEAVQVHRDGFTLRLETWGDTHLSDLGITWTAIEAPLAYKDPSIKSELPTNVGVVAAHNSQKNPGRSCKDILMKKQSQGNGIYWIRVLGGYTVRVMCDMNNGGWTRVINIRPDSYMHAKSSNMTNAELLYDETKAARLSDEQINAIRTIEHWRFSCGTYHGFVRNKDGRFTSAVDNDMVWSMSKKIGSGEHWCAASSRGHTFSDEASANEKDCNPKFVKFAAADEEENTGCYHNTDEEGWNQAGALYVQ